MIILSSLIKTKPFPKKLAPKEKKEDMAKEISSRHRARIRNSWIRAIVITRQSGGVLLTKLFVIIRVSACGNNKLAISENLRTAAAEHRILLAAMAFFE